MALISTHVGLRRIGVTSIGVLTFSGMLGSVAHAQDADAAAPSEGGESDASHVVQQGEGVTNSARGIEKSDIRRGQIGNSARAGNGAGAGAGKVTFKSVDASPVDPASDSGDGLGNAATGAARFKAGKALADTVKSAAPSDPGSSGGTPRTDADLDSDGLSDGANQRNGDPVPGIGITINQGNQPR
ncbi:MAG: hypothetical protein CVT75_04435 [Alphaproteobacteria bacterium HGW-Alphaproteobacteria-14]|nr:MAG: hypothetical protein CVT75_04435 [Alphaproteobacteria bacterium HGW-Alphaproteobacteria-14]